MCEGREASTYTETETEREKGQDSKGGERTEGKERKVRAGKSCNSVVECEGLETVR